MKEIEALLECRNNLFRYAWSKLRNTEESNDLVADTILKVLTEIKNGKKIQNLKSYSMTVIHNEICNYFDKLKKSDILILAKQNDLLVESQISEQDNDDDEFELIIRRELAHLSKKYREVISKHYFENEKIKDISNKLDLTESSVISRLDEGKKKMKKAVKDSKSYTDASYSPEYLNITFGGRVGINGEPQNIISNLIDHNVLILAYQTPLSTVEISKKMGISTAYIEESVEKLLKYELLRKSGKNVFTDFLIQTENEVKNLENISKNTANDTFEKVKVIFDGLVREYDKLGIINEYNNTQKYLYAVFSMCYHGQEFMINKLNLLQYHDYPERGDIGKWVIDFAYQSGKKTETPNYQYAHGAWICKFSNGISTEEWDSAIGNTYRADYSIQISGKERASILTDIFQNKKIDEGYNLIIKDFIRLGFIKPSKLKDKNWDVCVPIISKTEYKTLTQLNKKYGEKFTSKIGKDLIKVVTENKIKSPKWIDSNQVFLNLGCLLSLPLSYVYRATETGCIKLEKDKNYPLYLIIKDKVAKV